MKTITYVTAGLWKNTGGPAESVPKIIKEICKSKDFQINLITLDGDFSENVIELRNYGVKIYVVKKTSSKNLYFNPHYIKVFKEVMPKSDIIHIQGVWLFPFWIASFFAKRLNKKIVISPRGSLSPNRLQKSMLKKIISKCLFDKRMLNYADLIHSTSEIEKENVKKFGINTPSAVIPNGVDFIDPTNFKKKIINSEKKICLFLGRLDPVKGLDMLIDTWRKIKNDNWILIICGPDERGYRQKLQEKINIHKLTNDIKIIDPIFSTEKYNLFTQSDLFVLPSYGENFGISIAEALISGLPVITTNLTPWDDLIKYNCGWLINLDQIALVNAFKEAFLKTDKELNMMGQRGIKLIKEKYDWKELSQKMIYEYKKLLNEENTN